jgi:hypothetical protein
MHFIEFHPRAWPSLCETIRLQPEPPQADVFQLQILDFVHACRTSGQVMVDIQQAFRAFASPKCCTPIARGCRSAGTPRHRNEEDTVLGASGFVGAHLCERLIAAGTDEVVPVIHSSGSAWRLARRGVPLRSANLLDKHEIASALNGCTHVVNCSRGGDDVMLRGLRNLLDVCDGLRIAGFVHLSSVMVTGIRQLQKAHRNRAIA